MKKKPPALLEKETLRILLVHLEALPEESRKRVLNSLTKAIGGRSA